MIAIAICLLVVAILSLSLFLFYLFLHTFENHKAEKRNQEVKKKLNAVVLNRIEQLSNVADVYAARQLQIDVLKRFLSEVKKY